MSTGTVALVAHRLRQNYYHWLFDVLPRFGLIQQAGFSWSDLDTIAILWDHLPFQRQSLQRLGIPLDRCQSLGVFRADQLIAPTPIGDVLSQPTPWICRFLRDTFIPETARSPRRSPRRLYLERGLTRYRQVANEAAVIEELATLGFEAVRLDQLSFLEQVQIMSEAEVVIAPHGAGNANWVFCPPQTTVIEIFSPGYIVEFYWTLAHCSELRYFYTVGNFSDRTPQNILGPHCQYIEIDVMKLKQTLKLAGVL